MNRNTAIVITTIFKPTFLDGYLENIQLNGWKETAVFFIILDRPPPSVYEASKKARQKELTSVTPICKSKYVFSKKLNLPEVFIPWDSDNRRNIGF